MPQLPDSRDAKCVGVGVLVGLLLAATALQLRRYGLPVEAPPAIEDNRVDARTEDVRRGPAKITRRTEEIKPDGTKKITEEVRELGPEERRTAVASEESHSVVPPAPAKASRTRYVGLGVDPLDYARLPRLRAGVTLWSAFDVGLAYDARRPVLGGALAIEAAYRF